MWFGVWNYLRGDSNKRSNDVCESKVINQARKDREFVWTSTRIFIRSVTQFFFLFSCDVIVREWRGQKVIHNVTSRVANQITEIIRSKSITIRSHQGKLLIFDHEAMA